MKKLLFLIFISILLFSTNNSYAKLKSASVLSFGDNNILFVGDSKAGIIYAFETTSNKSETSNTSYNILDFDKKIASSLGTTADKILTKDLAIHPVSKEAYVAVSRITGDSYKPAILILNQNGDIKIFDTNLAKSTNIKINNAPAKSFKFYEKIDTVDLTFTDIDYKDKKIYVSGLSNADFAATLRVINYPFSTNNPSSQEIVNVEIYHANHDQMETRAPIRAMDIVNLDGKNYIIAAYTCTPLVIFPLDGLKNGSKVVGKTIAELGYGNTPIDFAKFTAEDMEKNKFDVLFLTNKNQMAQVITINDILQSSRKSGLNKFTNFKRSGTKAHDIPMTGVLNMANQDDYRLLTIRYNPDNNKRELVSFMKNIYMRISDYQSEYEIPGFKYPNTPTGETIKGIQNWLKKEEGFKDLIQ